MKYLIVLLAMCSLMLTSCGSEQPNLVNIKVKPAFRSTSDGRILVFEHQEIWQINAKEALLVNDGDTIELNHHEQSSTISTLCVVQAVDAPLLDNVKSVVLK